MRRQRSRFGLLVAIAVSLLLADHALADVVTDRTGSILVFPKVIADSTRDTIIQITNVSNSLVRAHCFYVNAALTDPTRPEGPLNPRLWQEVDFDITLTRQQPTHWVVSKGRRVNPFDPTCGPSGICVLLDGGAGAGGGAGTPPDPCDESFDCDPGYVCTADSCTNAGFDPGLIPPVVPDFEGELKCVEVDQSGAPLSGNHLKGEALLVYPESRFVDTPAGVSFVIAGEVSKYNGIAIVGSENNGDGSLILGGGQCVGSGAQQGQTCRSDDECGDSTPCAIEYNGCPETWILNHLADGAPNLVLEAARLGTDQVEFTDGPSQVFTQLTVVPCTQNFETQVPTSVTLQFLTTNEFESQFSVSTTITCWGNFFLEELGATALTFPGTLLPDPQGTMYLQTRIRSAGGTPFGTLMVAEEFHIGKEGTLDAVEDLHGGGAGFPLPIGDFGFVSPAAVNLHVEGERAIPDVITIPDEQLAP